MLSAEEKRELLKSAKSIKLREEFKLLSKNRINPFIENGEVNMDYLLEFLTEYNNFIGHKSRPVRKIIDRNMRL